MLKTNPTETILYCVTCFSKTQLHIRSYASGKYHFSEFFGMHVNSALFGIGLNYENPFDPIKIFALRQFKIGANQSGLYLNRGLS